MLDKKYYDSKKRLENVSFNDLTPGTNIETSFGTESIIDMAGEKTIGGLTLRTITQAKISKKNALIHTTYSVLEKDKSAYSIDMEFIFEGEPLYKVMIERAESLFWENYINSYKEVQEKELEEK